MTLIYVEVRLLAWLCDIIKTCDLTHFNKKDDYWVDWHIV